MLILLLPMTTIVVALVGFYVWHRQLVRKRHFEVADAALSAFCQAEAAIARAREPSVSAGEGTTRKRGEYELPAYSGLLDRLYIPVERLKVRRSAFEELERAAVHVEVHFGSELARHLREPSPRLPSDSRGHRLPHDQRGPLTRSQGQSDAGSPAGSRSALRHDGA